MDCILIASYIYICSALCCVLELQVSGYHHGLYIYGIMQIYLFSIVLCVRGTSVGVPPRIVY